MTTTLAADTLQQYVPDSDAYQWTVRQEGRFGATPYTELTLVSQEWRGIQWRHQLLVFHPMGMEEGTDHALLYIDGGRWSDELDDPEHRPELPSEARLYSMMAEQIGAPVAVVRQVPFQPLMDGRTEDDLIAHTFGRYLETGDASWPVLLPMVRSAQAALDAVGELSEERWGTAVDRFTVSGGSKRGWTTWLLSAVDDRVRGLAPLVIDVLNMEAHLAHQRESWGEFSSQIAAYTENGLHQHLETERGQRLLDMVDPYRHLHRIDAPALVVLGTNDEYWPVDALNLYWDEIQGPARIMYIPNIGHSADDYPRVLGGLASLHLHVMEEEVLPEPTWEFREEADRLVLRVGSDVRPFEVRAWHATAPGRDFRGSQWSGAPCRRDGRGWVCSVERPDEGHAALFAELSYPGPGPFPMQLTTQVRVVGSPDPVAGDRNDR